MERTGTIQRMGILRLAKFEPAAVSQKGRFGT